MPTMVVATLYDLYKTIAPNHNTAIEGNIAPLAMDTHGWIVLAIGFVISFIVALAVVAWFMRWVRTRGFVPFAIYRVILGIVMLVSLARGLI
jgi:undecaprenyl-diphosphatase